MMVCCECTLLCSCNARSLDFCSIAVTFSARAFSSLACGSTGSCCCWRVTWAQFSCAVLAANAFLSCSFRSCRCVLHRFQIADRKPKATKKKEEEVPQAWKQVLQRVRVTKCAWTQLSCAFAASACCCCSCHSCKLPVLRHSGEKPYGVYMVMHKEAFCTELSVHGCLNELTLADLAGLAADASSAAADLPSSTHSGMM